MQQFDRSKVPTADCWNYPKWFAKDFPKLKKVDWATASKDLLMLFSSDQNEQHGPIHNQWVFNCETWYLQKGNQGLPYKILRYLEMMWYSLPDERRAAAENHVSNIPDREKLAKKWWEWVQEVEAFNERKHEWTDERSTPFWVSYNCYNPSTLEIKPRSLELHNVWDTSGNLETFVWQTWAAFNCL